MMLARKESPEDMKRLFILMSCLGLMACTSGEDGDGHNHDNPDAGENTPRRVLTYDFGALPDLGADYVYEGWIIVDDEPVSTGRFSVDDNAMATPSEFELDVDQADRATLFVLTIEPAVGDDPAPAPTHILAGPIENGEATLITNHGAALNTDFSTAAGSYILATPTTGDDSVPEQGIWWLAPGEPATASLDLPELPEGWVYEGWVVSNNMPISTGRFSSAEGGDSDLAGPAKGPSGDGPPFPGQDFIDPALALNDGATAAVISVEPDPDNSPLPFLIKPLVHSPIADVVAPTLQTMTNNAADTLPAGRALISE
jgi:hypothetical protein